METTYFRFSSKSTEDKKTVFRLTLTAVMTTSLIFSALLWIFQTSDKMLPSSRLYHKSSQRHSSQMGCTNSPPNFIRRNVHLSIQWEERVEEALRVSPCQLWPPTPEALSFSFLPEPAVDRSREGGGGCGWEANVAEINGHKKPHFITLPRLMCRLQCMVHTFPVLYVSSTRNFYPLPYWERQSVNVFQLCQNKKWTMTAHSFRSMV